MRKLLVLQHVATEPLGTLDPLFRKAAFRIRYVNFERHPEHAVDVARYDGLVVLGGPMAADETDRFPHLAAEREAIREAIDREIPVLGICLGAQLIAAALGGRTLRGAAPEKGWTEVAPTDAGRADPLLGYLDGGRHLFQWHDDTFSLPESAVHLARSADCEYQAFRVGESAYGLQFHLEADRALIERWVECWSDADLRAEAGAESPRERIARDTDRHLERATRVGEGLFSEFIDRFYRGRRRRIALASRG